MTRSRKIYRINVEGMIVEEIDGVDDKDLDKVNPPDSGEFIVFNHMEQLIPLLARP